MGVDPKKLKERWDKKGSQRADRIKLQDGDNYLRILPPSLEYLMEEVEYISVDYLMHYKIGVEGNYSSEICPKTFGKQNKCPICETVFKLYSTKDAGDREIATRIRAKTRNTYNVIDLNDLDKGIQIMEQGPQIYEEIVKFIANPKYSDILDLDKGRNVTITRIPEKESASGFVTYTFIPDPDVTSVKDKLPKNWKEQIAKLRASVAKPKSYDELKKILEGEDTSNGSGDSDKAEAAEPAAAPAAAKKAEPKKAASEKPDCFGKDFGPKREECIPCDFKAPCREEYLKID